MQKATHEVRVFVASPGDCDAERQAVRSVATAVTEALGPQLGVRLRVDGWETVTPDYGRPQDLINPLVDECDVFIGLLGHRWGMPTGSHSSGFLEEFERAAARRVNTSEPQIAIYFRQPPDAMLADPGRELRKVIAFQDRLRKEGILLYRTFPSLADLERQLWPLLSQVLMVGSVAERASGDESSAGATAAGTEATTAELEADQVDEARRQIAEAAEGVAQLARGTAAEPALDPDRFLLIALALNDDAGFLPTHVGNRLYRRAADLALSMMERTLWFRSLLADAGRSGESREFRVLPGWAPLGIEAEEVTAHVSDRDDFVARGALEVLSRLRARPPELWPAPGADKEMVKAASATWLRLLRLPAVTRVAEKYLASVAGQDDLPLLEAILSDESLPNIDELRLALAGDLTSLAHAVAAKSYEPGWKAAVVQSNLPSVSGAVAAELAVGKYTPTALRAAAAHELNRRDALSTEVLHALLAEPSLIDEVFAWADDPGSSVTIAQVVGVVVGLDDASRRRNELLARARAAISSTSDLLAELDADNSRSSWDALEWKSDPELVGVAREVFDTDAERLVAPLASKPEWRDPEDLTPYIRATSRRGALRILMRQDPVADEDLDRLRKEVSGESMYTRQETLNWLAEHATAEDLGLLLTQLEAAYGETSSKVTAAILRIGGSAAARDLIAPGDPRQPTAAVRTLGDDVDTTIGELQELLYSPTDVLRVAALDQIISRSDDEQLKQLLFEYPRAGRAYYYNVVCELDWLLYRPGHDEAVRRVDK